MDSYEKKYKESLARAREIHFSKDEMEYIFPELKESEDENIRKAILSELDYLQNKEGWSDFGDYQIEDVIAWLEKQGEQKPVEPQQDMLSQEKYAKAVDECVYGEQKSAEWSEEYKMMLQYAIEHFERQKRNYTEGGDGKKAMQEFIDWLKSLRPQSTWKPSDEQMDALQYVCRNLNPPLSDKLGWDSLKTLELLYKILKKLY